ncbi:MAG TPA: phosphate regulon sensor histidine kinase PhoR [Candidatus Competibacteraceae bacterium]|nr:phosphate regulon sensor histidine kinase PhoR [Candidatus Competibacteraceae bacterium]
MRKPMLGLLGRTLLALAGLAGAGWLSGYPLTFLLLGSWGLLAWHLYQLVRLERELAKGKDWRIQDVGGLWGEVYSQLFKLQKQYEQRERLLKGTLGKFREAIAAVPDAAVALDDSDAVLWANQAAERLLGLHMPQDSGQRLANLVRHPAFVAFLGSAGGEEGVEFPAPSESGRILHARLIPYGQGQRLLIATDITRMHRLEQVRRDFVANVSHELRTPLTVINGYLETLLDSDDPCIERWQRPLRGMAQQSGRMLHIIEDLLMLSRLENDAERRPEKAVAMPELLAALAEDAIALSGERGHQVQVAADPGLWVQGCEKEIRSACANLVFNAVRHTPAGSRVEIRWFVDEQGCPCLQVADNGEGIPAQHIPRLTERFYRVDKGRQRESGGTGLGLAIVKHVMQRHGGQLGIISQLGVGSTFTCRFPAERRRMSPGKSALG